MNALTDVNLTSIMEREGIYTIKRWNVGPYSVELRDGRSGTGATVGEALAKAKADDLSWLRVAS